METSKVWNTCVDPSSGRRYWYNKLTGYRTWKQPSEQDNVTRIEELKPDLRDLVVQRRLTKALKFFEKRQERELAGLRTVVPMRDVQNDVMKQKKSSLKRKDTNEICGKYEHRSRRRTETVVMKVELRPDHQFTYSQDRTRKGTTNRVYGTGTWSLVPGSKTQSLQLRLDGRFIADGSVLTQVRNYPFSVFKKAINRLDVHNASSRRPPCIPQNETPMERKARVIDESTDRELTMRFAGDGVLKQMISEGKNESLLFALGLRK